MSAVYVAYCTTCEWLGDEADNPNDCVMHGEDHVYDCRTFFSERHRCEIEKLEEATMHLDITITQTRQFVSRFMAPASLTSNPEELERFLQEEEWRVVMTSEPEDWEEVDWQLDYEIKEGY
jgi:hypothetical protein